MAKKPRGRSVSGEFGAVDPRPAPPRRTLSGLLLSDFATLIPGVWATTDKLNGDELILPPNTILTPSKPWHLLTVREVDDLLARTQEVRLLFRRRTGWRDDVYDVGGGNTTKAWRRLRPMYLLENGYPPQGYGGTSLVAETWLGDDTTTLMFDVGC